MGGESDPFRLLRRDQPAEEAPALDLLAEIAGMARRLALGPLFLVHADDYTRAAAELERLTLIDGVDHRVTLRRSPFVEAGTLLVITAEARAAAADVGITDELLANPQPPGDQPA